MHEKKGFTLIELLVVIAIIALLSSIVLAALTSARTKGRLAAAQSFATQTYRAIGAYATGNWEFEEQSNTTISDTSGNANNGFITGSVTYVQGPISSSKAIGFFNDAYALVANSSTLQIGTSDFTIMFWLRTSGYVSHGSAYNIAVAKGDCCGSNGVAVGYGSTNLPTIFINTVPTVISSVAIDDNEWHHVAAVRSGTKVSLYMDGKLAGSAVTSSVANVTNTDAFFIGKDLNGVIRSMRGYVDNVVVVPSSLTASEVHNVYAAESVGRMFASEQ